MPLFAVGIALAQLGIPKVGLPNRLLCRCRPLPRNHRLPKYDPRFQRRILHSQRRIEKMHMVWHQHIVSHDPLIRLPPCTNHHVMRHRIRKMDFRSLEQTVTKRMDERFTRSTTGWCAGCFRPELCISIPIFIPFRWRATLRRSPVLIRGSDRASPSNRASIHLDHHNRLL